MTDKPVCTICGRAMRQYGGEWKCMTSPKDHAAIIAATRTGKPGGPPGSTSARRAQAARARKAKRKKDT